MDRGHAETSRSKTRSLGGDFYRGRAYPVLTPSRTFPMNELTPANSLELHFTSCLAEWREASSLPQAVSGTSCLSSSKSVDSAGGRREEDEWWLPSCSRPGPGLEAVSAAGFPRVWCLCHRRSRAQEQANGVSENDLARGCQSRHGSPRPSALESHIPSL